MNYCNNNIDQRPARVNYYIKHEDDFLKEFEFFDSNDDPLDMSDVDEIDFMVDNVSLANLTSGLSIHPDHNNVVVLEAQNELAIGDYIYELIVVDEGYQQTYLSGKLKVT
jgi:hypothetical protein